MLDEHSRKETRDLNEALAKAQSEFPPIPREKKVTVRTKDGGSFTYAYADLAAILAAVRPVLAANGLALVQILEDDGRGPSLRTELRHSGGGGIYGTFPLPRNPDDPQALGSLLTYLRRYAVTAVLGIATEDDDDGAGAKPKGGKPKGGTGGTGAGFTPPAPKPDPELAGLVTEVQAKFEALRKLEADLGTGQRDWPAWVRHKLGLAEGEIGGPEHYRQALDLLGREESKLVAELAEKTAQEAEKG